MSTEWGIILFNLSKLWNRFAFSLIHLGVWMIWDYSGYNKETIAYDLDEGIEDLENILCTFPNHISRDHIPFWVFVFVGFTFTATVAAIIIGAMA